MKQPINDREASVPQDPVHLLIVEDQPEDVELELALLRRAGFNVSAVSTDLPGPFLQKLRDERFDLVISDHNLRSWTGMDALEMLQTSGQDIPLIVVTASLGDEAAAEYIKRGASAYLLKDRLERLPIAVAQALRDQALRRETQHLYEQLRLQAAVLESAANAIVITDTEGTIQWVNPAFERLTGYAKAEAVGNKPSLLKSGETSPAVYESLWQTVLAGQVWAGEVRNRRKDGTLYTESMTITPVRDSQGKIGNFVAIKQDITAQRSLEEQFRQAQKMEAVGRLAGGVAHDFNNILMVISSYAELLLQRGGRDPLGDSYMVQIRDAAARGAEVTKQLLAFSRKQILAPAVIDLNTVLTGLQGTLLRLIGEDVDVSVVLDRELGSVKADAGQIGQILMNLAVNARDAMPRGGRLVIETANIEADEHYVRTHSGMRPGPYVMLSVTDNGEGMDDATRARIFEPFFTTKGEGKGTGLGLATVYGIVKQSDGFVWVYSEKGVGTTFKIHLPRVSTKPVVSATPKVVEEGDLAGTETILLVEDEPALREAVGAFLEAKGYVVHQAANGIDALKICREAPALDLLLTDLVMPNMGGIDLARAARPLHPRLAVIYMSGYTENTVDVQQFQAGGVLLQKPFRLDQLAQKVRLVLAERERGQAAAAGD